MAEVPVIVPIGSDIMAGFFAKLSDVPPDKLVQWYGATALSLTNWPMNAQMPGVRAWQHKRPFATTETRNVVAVPSTSVITIDGVPLVSPDDVGTWLYVSVSPTAQGQLKRITAVGGADVTVHAPFSPPLTEDTFFGGFGKVTIIRDSHRVAAGSTPTRIFRHTSTPAFNSSVVGRSALFFAAYDTDILQLKRKIIAQDGVSITLDYPLLFDSGQPGAPPIDSGFAVLTGGDLPSDAVQDLAGFANGAALRPLAINLDSAPVNATGYVYSPWDTGTPFASPLAEVGVKATVAAIGSDTVTVERSVFNILLDVGSQIKVGSQARTITQVNSPIQVTVNTLWTAGPSLPVIGDQAVLVRATVNCVAQLAFRMRNEFAMPLVVAELGATLSMVSPFVLTPGPTASSWAHDLTSLDWHPSSPASMFVALKSMLSSVKALIEAEGNTAKFYICIDAITGDAVADRYLHIGENLTLLRDAIRAHVQDPAMPFIVAGPSAYGSGPPDLRPAIYEQLAAMKRADAWTSYFDNREGISYAFDNAHIAAAGQIVTADRFADTLIEVIERNGELADETAFIVEDGTAKVDANSLCTVEVADIYLQSLEDPPQWKAATTKVKRDALRRMSRWITYRRQFQGQKTALDQALAFPRFGLVDESGFPLASDSVPQRVQQAAAYGAYRIVKGDWAPFPDESIDGGLQAKSVGVGPIQINKSYSGTRRADTETRLPLVEQLLSIFTLPQTAGSMAVRIGRG